MERHAMLRLNDPGHPNVIRLLETFKDEDRVCFLYELAEGGELWDHIKYAGLMDREWAVKVIAQVVSAVEYLHSKNIIHRDLKAENFVLTRDGIVKLIDLGNAMDLDHPEVAAPGLGSTSSPLSGSFGCRMSGWRPIRRPTFQHYVGTPQFMPPEAIKNRDSGKLRDLWSLGCTIYQILTGSPPFSGSTDYFILLRVEARSLEFPPDFDPLARDLVERLLVADPEKRLGASDFREIKSHPFFRPESFDTSCLIGRRFPSLQELCVRKILKRFHALMLEAMDKERDAKSSLERAPQSKANCEDDERAKQNPSGPNEKRIDSVEGESSATEDNSPDMCSKRDPSGQPSRAQACCDWPAKGIGIECAQQLLDQVVPRELREQAPTKLSPHLRILIERLEYLLRSQGRQFSKECLLADEWDRKHSRQCNSSDGEDGDDNLGGGHCDKGTGS